jgi:DNA-binding GntR family transcriptional regulator
VSGDEQLRDQIIRATNNQSAIEQAALHATDKIQRDIEQILERHDFYYERRKNYYRNIGKPVERFVTPMYVAAGYVAVILKQPASAARLKPRFMRNEARYEQVFSENAPIELWPRLVGILKAAEREMIDAQQSRGERALRTWRGLIALLYASKAIGRFSFSPAEFCKKINLNDIDFDSVKDCFRFVEGRRLQSARQEPTPAFCREVCKEFGELHSLPGIQSLMEGQTNWSDKEKRQREDPLLPKDFLVQVDTLLPAQPWPTGIDREVAEKLEVGRNKVQRAISQLVNSGRRIKQIDGVLYDAGGNIITLRGPNSVCPSAPASDGSNEAPS